MGSNSFRVIKWRQEKAAKTKPNTGSSKHIPNSSLIVPSQRLLFSFLQTLFPLWKLSFQTFFVFFEWNKRKLIHRDAGASALVGQYNLKPLRTDRRKHSGFQECMKKDRWTKMINNYPFGAYFKETGEFHSLCGKSSLDPCFCGSAGSEYWGFVNTDGKFPSLSLQLMEVPNISFSSTSKGIKLGAACCTPCMCLLQGDESLSGLIL